MSGFIAFWEAAWFVIMFCIGALSFLVCVVVLALVVFKIVLMFMNVEQLKTSLAWLERIKQ